jgi:predicted DsbA family dithiol-disulfide isomerase
MQKPVIQIEVVSDIVCPWCYIGKRRMERAVENLKDAYDFEIFFSPFELNPDMPQEGRNQKAYLAGKFGGEERYQQITDHVTEIARGEGLSFHYEKQSTSPNTRMAHRIIWYARQVGKQAAIKEAFLKAYFENGVDLSKKENMVDIAFTTGLSKERIESLLSTDEGEAEVALAERISLQRGVSGVPFYIINNQYGLSGAQPSETFEKVIREIAEKNAKSEN